MARSWREPYWARVDIREQDDCWPWKGNVHSEGYGRCWIGGKWVRAHRLAWRLSHGAIPEDMCICHHCDNPICCNPTHLFVGTRADNARDCLKKGRWPVMRGVRNGSAKLSSEQVRQIRALYASGKCTQVELGKRFNVRPDHVGQIVRRELWTWLDEHAS